MAAIPVAPAAPSSAVVLRRERGSRGSDNRRDIGERGVAGPRCGSVVVEWAGTDRGDPSASSAMGPVLGLVSPGAYGVISAAGRSARVATRGGAVPAGTNNTRGF